MAKAEDPRRMATQNDKDAKRLNGRRAVPGIARLGPMGYVGFNTRAVPLRYMGDVHQGRVISWYIRPLVVRPLTDPERCRSPWGCLLSSTRYGGPTPRSLIGSRSKHA